MSQCSPDIVEAIARIRASVTDTDPDRDFSGFDPIEDVRVLLAEYDRLREHKRLQAEDIITLGQEVGRLSAPARCSAGSDRQKLQATYNDLLGLQDQTDQVPLTKALDAVGLALSILDAAQPSCDRGAQALLVVRQMVEAFDSGNLQMNSPEIGEPENDIPYHPWHEEMLHYARLALKPDSPPISSTEDKS